MLNHRYTPSLSIIVYTLHYPLVVSTGTVVGFLTRRANAKYPKSNVKLYHSGTLVGYNRDVLAAAILINTGTIQTSSARIIPLIWPITAGKLNNLYCPKLSISTIRSSAPNLPFNSCTPCNKSAGGCLVVVLTQGYKRYFNTEKFTI